MNRKTKGLKKVLETKYAAQRKVREWVGNNLGVGTRVGWLHGRHEQTGEVVMTSGYARVLVRNDHTGNEVWLEADKIEEIL